MTPWPRRKLIHARRGLYSSKPMSTGSNSFSHKLDGRSQHHRNQLDKSSHQLDRPGQHHERQLDTCFLISWTGAKSITSISSTSFSRQLDRRSQHHEIEWTSFSHQFGFVSIKRPSCSHQFHGNIRFQRHERPEQPAS